MSIFNFLKQRDLDLDFVLKWLPFTLFLFIISILYIRNAHITERLHRKVGLETDSIKQFRWQYTEKKSKLMNSQKPSEMAKRAESLGLKQLKKAPQSLEY